MNSNKIGYLGQLLLLFIVVTLSGCRSVSKVAKPEAAAEYLSSKLELTVPTKDAVYTISGTLKAHKGEIIQMSFLMPILRTEIARIEASKEDILFLDRVNHRYARASKSSLTKGVSLSSLFTKLDDELFTRAQKEEQITLTPEQIGLTNLKKGQLVLSEFSFESLEMSPTQFSESRYQEVKMEELLQLLMSL